MNENEKREMILNYKNTVRHFKESVNNLSGEELDYRPKEEYWTIREHIAHVFDCEIFGFTRYRKSIAEPDSKVEGFDQDKLQSNLDYSYMDVYKATQTIELISDIAINHLISILSEDWSSYRIDHPERGKDSLESLVDRRISHIKTHIDYIKRNKSMMK